MGTDIGQPGPEAGFAAARLPATGMVDAWWLGRLVDGACDAEPAAVGYLANLMVMVEGRAFDPKLVTSARQPAS